ncbi:MAG TPA: putative porin [Blastocatellia bacterium]|nr:putative porin [Blastocatellia bacterium]
MSIKLDQLKRGRLIIVCSLLFSCPADTAVRCEAFTGQDTTAHTKKKAPDDEKSASASASSRASDDTEQPKAAAPSEASASSEAIDRIRALEEAVRSQNARLDEMRRLIESQQQTIRMLAGGVGGSSAPAAESSRTNPSATELAAAKEVAPGKASAAVQPQPQPTIEDRLKKVEERVTKIGPLQLGGDFRLRLDAILRGATEPPDPALQHVQNVRMRYRLRLNLDTDINKLLSFHGQLSTGPFNNALTQDQDFTATVVRAPFLVSEAWVEFHSNKEKCRAKETAPADCVQLQGGRVQEVFADNSRFIFDDDVRFNGFNQRFVLPLNHSAEKAASIELRAGQYWFSNPNVAIVTAGSPLAVAGAEVGSTGRNAMLFHQGVLWNQKFNERWSQQLGTDFQFYKEPNQIQLASTANGVVFLVQPGLGVALSGPVTGTGNATTTPGGAIYTAESFHVGRFTYRLNNAGFHLGEHDYPIIFNLQGARNFGAEANERDAMLASLQVGGRPSKFRDMAFLYVFAIKGANSIISQLTDDDLGTNSGVNIRAHYFRWEFGLARNVTLQSLFFVQNQLRSSGQFPNFFVPLGAFTPRQYRFQEQMLFSF